MEDADAKLPEHVLENRRFWDEMAHEWVSAGERSWQRHDPIWGIWQLPEEQLRLLPESMAAMKAVELGCGTGYVSGWMTRRGAVVSAIDNSAQQLATATRLADEHQAEIRFLHGDAERTPFEDGEFDFAISEYGAAIWCDPRVWIPEAHRILKPGGLLTFLGTHPLGIITTPPSGDVCEAQLHQPYFNLHRQDWRQVEIDPGGIEFNLTISEWIQLFHKTGFRILNYQELQAPAHESETRFTQPAAWAQQWPGEQVWQLQKV